MSAYYALSPEDKAVIVAVYETEAAMQAIELAENNPDKAAGGVQFGEAEG